MCITCGVVWCDCPHGGENIYYTSGDLARLRGFDVLDNEEYDPAEYIEQASEGALVYEPAVAPEPIKVAKVLAITEEGVEITDDDLPF